MVAEGHTVASLTGGIEGSQRDAVIDAFRSGEAKVLITTNVLARGIDVSTVSLVINYVCLPDMIYFWRLCDQELIFLLLLRTFPTTIPQVVPESPISRPICTVSAVLAVSVASALPFHSSLAVTSGTCCVKSSSTLAAKSTFLIPVTGMRLRRSSRRLLRIPVPKLTLPSTSKLSLRVKFFSFLPSSVLDGMSTRPCRLRPE